ncbi:hypothetical protein [Ruegeria arenilitoris]|nr:hypothetical protein [Ruegeria arenilitoris]
MSESSSGGLQIWHQVEKAWQSLYEADNYPDSEQRSSRQRHLDLLVGA